MNNRGHNERSFRLDELAEEARRGLESVEKGEELSIAGWLAYGHALNEGRALFPGDKEFGEWIDVNALRQVVGAEGTPREVHDPERAAAMWAAANADQFEEARQRGNPRTIRGIHAKWKEIEAERERERLAEERRQKAEVERAEAAERAERARAEAEEKAEQEAKARKAVKTADEDSREEAEQRAAQAAEERQAAERAAEEAAAAASQDEEPEEAPDPYAEERKGLSRYTREGLEDALIEARIAFEDERARRKKAEAEAKDLKEKLAQHTADDKDEVIRALNKKVKNAGDARWKALEDRDAFKRQVHAQKKEIEQLRKSLKNQEITLC